MKAMEDVAEVAVDRCRRRLVNLQNKVEKRKDTLAKVREKLETLGESNVINEDCENVQRQLELRHLNIASALSEYKAKQKNQNIRALDIMNDLKGVVLRILKIEGKIDDEKEHIKRLESEFKNILH